MRILFLDDDLKRHERFRELMSDHEIVFVETPEQAVDALAGGFFSVASLDHDLDGKIFQPSDEKSGFAVCQYIREMEFSKIPSVVICHSYNPDGVKAMMAEIEEPMLDKLSNAYAAPFDSDEYWSHFPVNEIAIERTAA